MPCPLAFVAAALAGLAWTSPVSAQMVRGIVVEVGSGTPIEDARLILRDPEGAVRAAAVSGSDGRFELVADLSGMVRLEVSHLGYAEWGTASFALASDAVIDVEVKLGIEAIPLDPITVVAQGSTRLGRLAGFEQRMSDPGRAGGYFLTEDDILHRPMATPSRLALGVPGMSVGLAGSSVGLDRSVIMAGGCVARTFIDGVRVRQSGGHSIDDLLSPELIAGVEFYPRPITAPAQYRDGVNPCGVVLFWTKEPQVRGGGGLSMGRLAIGFGLIVGILTIGIIR
jgi:Carboxypeptidase regulatory-like domain